MTTKTNDASAKKISDTIYKFLKKQFPFKETKIVQVIDIFEKSYDLAYFLSEDKTIAIQIVVNALDRAGSAFLREHRKQNYHFYNKERFIKYLDRERKYIDAPYKPVKPVKNELQILQDLIYWESSLYEKRKEEDKENLSDQILIKHYIKTLVYQSSQYNAYYVIVGVCRLLFNFDFKETERISDIFYFLKESSHQRRCKIKLIKILSERFGDLLTISSDVGKQTNFELRQASPKDKELIKECLEKFSPWGIDCPLNEKENIINYAGYNHEYFVDHLFTKQDNADQNHFKIMHLIIHPSCFNLITGILFNKSPWENLEIPKFNTSKKDVEDSACKDELLDDLLRVMEEWVNPSKYYK